MNYKLIILIILLIASMYFWLNVGGGIERVISMLAMVILAFWAGRTQGVEIGESNKNAVSQQQPQFP